MKLLEHWETLKIGKHNPKWYIVTYLISEKELKKSHEKKTGVALADWLSEKFKHVKFSLIPHWTVFTHRITFKAGGYIETT